MMDEIVFLPIADVTKQTLVSSMHENTLRRLRGRSSCVAFRMGPFHVKRLDDVPASERDRVLRVHTCRSTSDLFLHPCWTVLKTGLSSFTTV